MGLCFSTVKIVCMGTVRPCASPENPESQLYNMSPGAQNDALGGSRLVYPVTPSVGYTITIQPCDCHQANSL